MERVRGSKLGEMGKGIGIWIPDIVSSCKFRSLEASPSNVTEMVGKQLVVIALCFSPIHSKALLSTALKCSFCRLLQSARNLPDANSCATENTWQFAEMMAH